MAHAEAPRQHPINPGKSLEPGVASLQQPPPRRPPLIHSSATQQTFSSLPNYTVSLDGLNRDPAHKRL